MFEFMVLASLMCAVVVIFVIIIEAAAILYKHYRPPWERDMDDEYAKSTRRIIRVTCCGLVVWLGLIVTVLAYGGYWLLGKMVTVCGF